MLTQIIQVSKIILIYNITLLYMSSQSQISTNDEKVYGNITRMWKSIKTSKTEAMMKLDQAEKWKIFEDRLKKKYFKNDKWVNELYNITIDSPNPFGYAKQLKADLKPTIPFGKWLDLQQKVREIRKAKVEGAEEIGEVKAPSKSEEEEEDKEDKEDEKKEKKEEEEEEQKEEVRPEEEGKEDEEEDDDDDFEDIDDEMTEEVFANMDASVIADMSVKSAMKAVEDAEKALNLAQNKVANDKASSVKADASAPFEAPPSKSDLIPPARLSTRYKEVDELNDDINYFITNFKDVLTNEEKIYGKMNKKDKKMLTRLHNKITGKIGTSSKSGKSENNILIGVDADTYIEERVKKIMKENTFNNLRSEDAVIPVEEDMRVKDTKNFGGYEVKRSPDGGLSSQKEGQYRNAPTTQPEEPERKKRTSGLKILNNTQRNRAKTAQRMVRNNPFLTKDKGFDLMYLY